MSKWLIALVIAVIAALVAWVVWNDKPIYENLQDKVKG